MRDTKINDKYLVASRNTHLVTISLAETIFVVEMFDLKAQ